MSVEMRTQSDLGDQTPTCGESLLVARTLLGAPGHTTRSKKLLEVLHQTRLMSSKFGSAIVLGFAVRAFFWPPVFHAQAS